MSNLRLNHLHFFVKDLQKYEEYFINTLGFKIGGRFTTDAEKLDDSLSWKDILESKYKIRLTSLKLGLVDIVLMPGKFEVPKLEHFGILVSPALYEDIITRAQSSNLKVNSGENRTFISSKLGFRLEIQSHERLDDFIKKNSSDLRISRLVFGVSNEEDFVTYFKNLLDVDFVGGECQLEGNTVLSLKRSESNFKLVSFEFEGDKKVLASNIDKKLESLLPYR